MVSDYPVVNLFLMPLVKGREDIVSTDYLAAYEVAKRFSMYEGQNILNSRGEVFQTKEFDPRLIQMINYFSINPKHKNKLFHRSHLNREIDEKSSDEISFQKRRLFIGENKNGEIIPIYRAPILTVESLYKVFLNYDSLRDNSKNLESRINFLETLLISSLNQELKTLAKTSSDDSFILDSLDEFKDINEGEYEELIRTNYLSYLEHLYKLNSIEVSHFLFEEEKGPILNFLNGEKKKSFLGFNF